MRGGPWLCGGLLLLAAGCVTHRGPWRAAAEPSASTTTDGAHDPGPATPEPGSVDLVLLGNLAPSDRGAKAVAARVQDVLDGQRPAVVLWLGDLAAAPMRTATRRALRRGPRCTPVTPDAWPSPTAQMLATATRAPTPAPPSFAATGILDDRCADDDTPGVDGSTQALRTPGTHYVLRVHTDGSVTERAWCNAGACRFPQTDTVNQAPALVELVVVNLGPWLHPNTDATARARDDQRVRSLDAMLDAVAQRPPEAAPPRLLVSSAPVEAAGEHGLGALWPDATFRSLPPKLQQMLVEGHFAGVLAAHDHSMTATADLSDAIKRADRAWLSAPVFQVQAGAITHPNRRAGMALRPLRTRRSQSFAAPVFSDHPGFAVVRLHGDRAQLMLHARRVGRWETATLDVPLRPAAHPSATPSPVMAPCRDCTSIPVNQR